MSFLRHNAGKTLVATLALATISTSLWAVVPLGGERPPAGGGRPGEHAPGPVRGPERVGRERTPEEQRKAENGLKADKTFSEGKAAAALGKAEAALTGARRQEAAAKKFLDAAFDAHRGVLSAQKRGQTSPEAVSQSADNLARARDAWTAARGDTASAQGNRDAAKGNYDVKMNETLAQFDARKAAENRVSPILRAERQPASRPAAERSAGGRAENSGAASATASTSSTSASSSTAATSATGGNRPAGAARAPVVYDRFMPSNGAAQSGGGQAQTSQPVRGQNQFAMTPELLAAARRNVQNKNAGK